MLLALLLTVLADCQLGPDDVRFISDAGHTWEEVRQQDLGLGHVPMPRLLFFDQRCLSDDGELSLHGGKIRLPDGNEVPARLMTFAGSYGGGKPFLVQALPPLWRAEERHKGNPKLDRLMRAVFVHEMTHTVQTKAFGDRLTELEQRYRIEELNDDIVQTRFSSNEEFVAAYKAERDALYAAAAAPDEAQRRALARKAVTIAKERRARFYAGDLDYLAELEEIFLGMEGAAQWAAFRAAVHDGAMREEAIAAMSKGGRFWSQDEGLALFLAIDALKPGAWQKQVFGEKAKPVWQLLEDAVEIEKLKIEN
jgi:hypothetical protein